MHDVKDDGCTIVVRLHTGQYLSQYRKAFKERSEGLVFYAFLCIIRGILK